MISAFSETQLCQLLYTSRIVPVNGGASSHHAIEQVAEAAAARNDAAGVTGCLVFVDGTVIQILEGASRHVEETFERICCDFRHEDLRLIDLVPIPKRVFPGWGMVCLSDGAGSSIGLRDGLEELRFLVGINAKQAVQQMSELVAAHACRVERASVDMRPDERRRAA